MLFSLKTASPQGDNEQGPDSKLNIVTGFILILKKEGHWLLMANVTWPTEWASGE